MNKLFIVVALAVSLFISADLGFCQTKTIIAGFTSDTTKKQELIFFDNNLEIIKRLPIGSFSTTVGEIRIFKNGDIERAFVGNILSPVGITVVDLKKQEVMGQLLNGNIINKIEIDSNGNLYALNGVDVLFIIDPESLVIKKVIQLDETRRRGFSVAISQKTGTLYIAEPMRVNNKNIIKVMSIDENGVKTDIGETDFESVVSQGIPIFMTEDEKKVYVVTNFKVSEFDLVGKKRRDINTGIEFFGDSWFDDATGNLCVFAAFEGFVKIINIKNGRKRKIVIGEPVTNAFIRGNGKGIVVSNTYRASKDLAEITIFNLKNKTVLSKTYEMFGSRGKVLVE